MFNLLYKLYTENVILEHCFFFLPLSLFTSSFLKTCIKIKDSKSSLSICNRCTGMLSCSDSLRYESIKTVPKQYRCCNVKQLKEMQTTETMQNNRNQGKRSDSAYTMDMTVTQSLSPEWSGLTILFILLPKAP